MAPKVPGACGAVVGSGGGAGAAAAAAGAATDASSNGPPQFEQKRPLGGLLVPQRMQTRSAGRGEKSNGGAAGRCALGIWLARCAGGAAGGDEKIGGGG